MLNKRGGMSYEKENRIYYLGNCIRLIRKEMKIMADLIILFRFLEVIVCVWGFVYVFGYVTMAFEGITAFHALTLYPKRLVSAILLLILLAYMYGASYSYCVQHDMEIANQLVDEYVPNAENADYHGLYEALCESDAFFISGTNSIKERYTHIASTYSFYEDIVDLKLTDEGKSKLDFIVNMGFNLELELLSY
jgi:hypothetical protein